MSKASDIAKRIIGDNLKSIRETLLLSHQELAEISGISKGSIIKMEGGKKGYTIDTLIIFIDKIGFTLPEISSEKTKIPEYDQLKNKITQYYNNKSTAVPVELFPNLEHKVKKLVLTRLIPDGYLKKPKTLSEILTYFKDEFGFTLKSTSLSNTLIRLSEEGIVQINKTDSTGFRYSSKKLKK